MTTEERVEAIYEEDPKLTTWEIDFLASIANWVGSLTEKQEDALCKIEEKAGLA